MKFQASETRRSAEEQKRPLGGWPRSMSREIALDQTAREQQALRPLRFSAADSLKEARAMLVEVLSHGPQHDVACEFHRFADRNRCLPANHPAWKSQPACTCWVGQVEDWLKNNPGL